MQPADLFRLQIWIFTFGSILELLLILRIFQLRLVEKYRAFLVFLICDFGRDLCLHFLGRDMSSNAYGIAWAASAPILWIPIVLAVTELCRAFYSVQPASREVQWMLVSAAVLASVVITLPVSAELIDSLNPLASWQNFIRIANRFVFMAGAVVLWTQRLYFFPTRPSLPHNLRVHRNAFTLYLSADATIRFASGLRDPILARRANLACSLLFCASLLIWLLGFRKPSEESAAQGEIASNEPAASHEPSGTAVESRRD